MFILHSTMFLVDPTSWQCYYLIDIKEQQHTTPSGHFSDGDSFFTNLHQGMS